MNERPGVRPPERENALREQGLQVAMRFVATLRTGRSYAIGNQAFTRQLQQFLDALLPVLAEHGEAQVVAMDGDLHLNGVRLPLRSSSLRFLEQLAQEFQVREIAGVEFREGLAFEELEEFMRFFLPSELYKGGDLYHACATQNLRHVLPVESVVEETAGEPAAPLPADDSGAMHAYGRALHNARLLLGDAAMDHGLELRHLKRVSQPLVDTAFAEAAGTRALSAVHLGGDSHWAHAVHVCVLAVAIGRQLGLDRAALSELGVAALLHDSGKRALSGLVTHPPGQRGPAERAEAESHALEGLRQIALCTTLNATSLVAMRAALEHHATGPDPYPALSPGWEVAPASRVVAIADAFISLLEHRDSGLPALTPCEALGRVLGPLAPHFHAGLRAALVRALGVYPPGQVVELNDGSLARSLGSDSDDPERPIIERLAAPGATPGTAPAGPPERLPAERSVRRALPLAEWPAGARAA